MGTIFAPGGIGSEVRALGSSQYAGEITELISANGSITGNISAAIGIQRITCANGTLGPATGLSDIRITTGSGSFGIGRIRAKSIRSNIDTTFGGPGGGGLLGQITTLGPAAPGGVGDFTGSLRASNLFLLYPGTTAAYLDIAGNLNADLTFLTGLAAIEGPAFPAAINIGGELPATRTIRVGLSMEGGNTGVGGIKITAAGGLKGQVMVNAQNGNPATYPWLGDVTVGSTLLDPGATGSTPYYPTLSSTLGGGAVGLVPFNLHKQDCLPIHDAGACSYPSRVWTSCGGGAARDTLILRHYGPIEDSDRFDSDLPVKVERQSLIWNCYYNQNGVWQCDPAPWEDVSTQVDVCVAPSEGGTPRPRELWIARKIIGGVAQPWWGGYQIRVTLMPNDTNPDLRSAGTLASTAPIIAGYPYRFATICDEPFGLSAGGWTNDDIAAWGASPTDLNNDGVADASDLALLVNLVTQTEQGGGWGNPPTE
jgi:hypothetical protein